MKLEKAIKLLQLDLNDPGSVAIEDLNEAQALGIEALKRIKECRLADYMIREDLLDGETEE